jgi:hypothetical protein
MAQAAPPPPPKAVAKMLSPPLDRGRENSLRMRKGSLRRSPKLKKDTSNVDIEAFEVEDPHKWDSGLKDMDDFKNL